MSLTTSTTIVGLCAAFGLAGYLGGTVGSGIAAGFGCGAATALVCAALQRRIARDRPQFLIQAVMGGFLFKAIAMLTSALIVRSVDALASRFDPLSFVLAFASTALVILLPATLDMLRVIASSSNTRALRTVPPVSTTPMQESRVS